MSTVKIFTIAHVPRELEQRWLQHLRDFDTAHPGCHFEVLADAPDATFGEMIEMLRVNPGLSVMQIVERKRTDCCRRYAMGQTFCDDCPATSKVDDG